MGMMFLLTLTAYNLTTYLESRPEVTMEHMQSLIGIHTLPVKRNH